MEWQQLEYFQVVANLQHMTRAAEALSISQPALSRSISRLEEELGVHLFERQGRTIGLNRYGRLFLQRVNRILKEYQEGRQEILNLVNPEFGEVSLGFLHTFGSQIIPDLVVSFRSLYPDVRFQLNENKTQLLLDQLESGEIDLCMASPLESRLQIQWVDLRSEELFVFVPKNHPLASRKEILLEEIANESLISFKKGYGLRAIVDHLLEEAGISPTITFEGEEVHTIAGLVASELGVALMPSFIGMDQSRLTLLPVQWPKCSRTIGIAHLEGRYLSPAAALFRQFVIDYFKERS